MATNRSQYERVLIKYIHDPYISMVVDLLEQYPVQFKIVKPRKTKLGDFRAKNKHGKAQITVNGDLNPYSFLITTLHEFAHLITYLEYGHRVAPHGKEWKLEYTKLLLPLIEHEELPEDLRAVLLESATNVKASSCTDQNLQRVLMTYDSRNDNTAPLETLPKNSIFELNGRQFRKGLLRRTRFLCTDIHTKRQYLVNALVHVELISYEE